MATSVDLALVLSDQLTTPLSTVELYGKHLRSAGLLNVSGRRHGAAAMTAHDAAAWLIALCIDHKRGGDFVREVKRVINLPLHGWVANPKDYAADLSHTSAKSAGQALALFICDMMVPRIRARLESGDDTVTANFDAGGLFVATSIFEHSADTVARFINTTYQRGERKRRDVERSTVVHGRVLLEIARLLEVEKPPE